MQDETPHSEKEVLREATDSLIKRLGDFRPEAAVVLGSGLGFFADERVEPHLAIPYEEVPGLPPPTVEGHAGQFVFGWLHGRPVACMQGRYHYYEGHSLADVVRPVRLLARLGVKELLLTNAAGGIRDDLRTGTLMLITDHINMLGANPLRGANDDSLGPRFPDMSRIYAEDLGDRARRAAAAQGIALAEGVYLAVPGPAYETPAEIRAFRVLGADAVGMSTVPEAIAARHAGLRVCGISCISNAAAGIGSGELSHGEVVAAAREVQPVFARLVTAVLKPS